MKLFRIVSSNGGTAYIATNDLSQSNTDATAQEYRVRWKIEQLHREIKQVTGIGTVNVVRCVLKEIILRVVFKYGSV